MARSGLTEPKTRLTGRPGALDAARQAEVWTPGIRLPREPRLASPRRRLWIVLSLILLIVIVTVGGWRLANINSSFDPSVDLDQVDPAANDA